MKGGSGGGELRVIGDLWVSVGGYRAGFRV
jgi:hypothetical protein